MSKNFVALIEYFRVLGYDANRVPANSVSAEGFEYIREQRDGRPIYGKAFELKTDKVAWPNPQDHANVLTLMGGGSKADIDDWPEIANATDDPSGTPPTGKDPEPEPEPAPKRITTKSIEPKKAPQAKTQNDPQKARD